MLLEPESAGHTAGSLDRRALYEAKTGKRMEVTEVRMSAMKPNILVAWSN